MTGAEPELRIETAVHGAAQTLRVHGDLCGTTAPLLAKAVDRCVRSGADVLRIDLRDCYADSAGFASLLEVCSDCRSAGVTLELASPPSTRRILTALGLPRRFRIGRDAITVRVVTPSDG